MSELKRSDVRDGNEAELLSARNGHAAARVSEDIRIWMLGRAKVNCLIK